METNASFSNDLAENYNAEILNARAIVHFRPSSDWKGQGYGFDWMRTGDYKKHIVADPQKYGLGDVPYRDIVKSQFRENSGIDPGASPGNEIDESLLVSGTNAFYGIFYQDKRALNNFRELEKKYNYRRIACKDPQEQVDNCGHYHCAWLSLYPETSATLSLLIEITDDEVKPIHFVVKGSSKEKGEEYLTIKRLDEGKMDKLTKGFHKFEDILTIKCIKEFNEDKVIEVYHGPIENNHQAGFLYIWANSERKKLNILFVNVHSGASKFPELDFDEMNHYFKQAYIEIDQTNTINLTLTEADAGIYFCQYEATNSTTGKKEIKDGLVASRTGSSSDSNEPYKSLIEYLNERDEVKNLPDKEKYLILYCADKDTCAENMRNPESPQYYPFGGGYSKQYHAIIVPPSISMSSLTHEILHALGLNHSFSNRTVLGTYNPIINNPNALFTYDALTTDNIMDYSDAGYTKKSIYRDAGDFVKLVNENNVVIDSNPRKLNESGFYSIKVTTLQYTLWKWQWEIANSNISRDGTIIKETPKTENKESENSETKNQKTKKKEKNKKK